ncbi:MAG: hypothetical protein QE274_08950 [Verrucomicrobiaceae bacterium]|nr:hypothetical protein [Verrucomicrobiaceae bacterium]
MRQAAAYRSAGYSPNRSETEAAKVVRTSAVSLYLDARRVEAAKAGVMTWKQGLALLGAIASIR